MLHNKWIIGLAKRSHQHFTSRIESKGKADVWNIKEPALHTCFKWSCGSYVMSTEEDVNLIKSDNILNPVSILPLPAVQSSVSQSLIISDADWWWLAQWITTRLTGRTFCWGTSLMQHSRSSHWWGPETLSCKRCMGVSSKWNEVSAVKFRLQKQAHHKSDKQNRKHMCVRVAAVSSSCQQTPLLMAETLGHSWVERERNVGEHKTTTNRQSES